MSKIEMVLVVGATGGTGMRVVKALRRRELHVRVLIRDAAKEPMLSADGVEVVVGDATSAVDLERAVAGVQAVISALGSRAMGDAAKAEAVEHTAIAQLAQAAAKAGVQQFVLCSSMGTETPDMVPPLATVLRAKRRGELALIESGVPYTIIRPGGLLDSPGGPPDTFFRNVGAAAKLPGFGAISRDDVAEVLVEAMLQPAARNKVIEIVNQPGAGPETAAGLFE